MMAMSRLAFSDIMIALFPPNSSNARPRRAATVCPTALPIRTEPVAETTVPEPVAVAASPDPVEAQPVQQEPAAMTTAPSLSAEAPLTQQRTVDAVAAPGAETKADNRWLAESLWRRVAELKRYPSIARLNGQEGKVILKAVIRSDGQLADVVVQKSSGYSALDAAAIEASNQRATAEASATEAQRAARRQPRAGLQL